jgi:hypothetical protein
LKKLPWFENIYKQDHITRNWRWLLGAENTSCWQVCKKMILVYSYTMNSANNLKGFGYGSLLSQVFGKTAVLANTWIIAQWQKLWQTLRATKTIRQHVWCKILSN